MKLFVCLLMVALCLTCVVGSPALSRAGDGYDPEEAGAGNAGDMLLSEEQKQMLRHPEKQGRNGLLALNRRWPKKTVIYKITGNYGAAQIAEIKKAIELLESETCIRFREATANDRIYVDIGSNPGGCYSAVGYQSATGQQMNLESYPVGEGCFRFGTILHEFMHVLGFYHEQSSADRDNYITVQYDNIIEGKEFNFDAFDASVVSDFGVGYDYDSCLHYRSTAFTKNGLPTIVTKDPSAEIGQRVSISKKDLQKINVMYKCPIKI